ncbi:MAG TPA: endonuclease/exonuclease/phosphatase family protein [Burkholderiaceae bacterium]|nr:endonuclease/exonuclease/phosphatase family protein [Burkholderiaceae bacterium]
MKLRVATYNIHKGVTALRGRPRIHDVRLALQAMDADIVFLQEVQDRNERLAHHHGYPKVTQLEFLGAGGYEHRAYGMNAIYPHGHHGNAILSRLPIRHFENMDVSDHALEKRGLLHAVAHVAGPGRKTFDLHLLCVHFGLIHRSRVRQTQFLADFVDAEIPPSAPLIIAGDFNDWQRRVDGLLRARLGLIEVADALAPRHWYEPFLPDALMKAPWLGAALKRRAPPSRAHLTPARTFPAFAPWLHLDRIYLRGCEVGHVQVPQGREWAKRSDHAPLIAQVRVG